MLGQVTPVALGHTTERVELDFETYSEAGYVWHTSRQRWDGPPGSPKGSKGLPVVGAYNSIVHPSFCLVWLAYDLKDGRGWRQWRPGLPPPTDLFGAIAAGAELEAWNVSYERWVWELHCVPQLGWPPVHDRQWRCAMAKARASALPGRLSEAGRVIGAQVQKDAAGEALMKRLSMPVNPTKSLPRTRVLPVYDAATRLIAEMNLLQALLQVEPDANPRRVATLARQVRRAVEDDAQDTAAYGRYNVIDILAEADVARRVPDQPADELAWWQVHERINRRGVHVDRQGIEDCVAVVEQALARYNRELADICGIDAASKVQQLQGWLAGRGHRLESLDEEHVAAALDNPLLPPDVRRVLEIRAAVGSAAVKKLFAMRLRLCPDSRLRDLYVYHGARTGRSTGEGPQPTNLPKAGPDLVPCECGKYYGGRHAACPFCGRLKAAKPAEWNPAMAEQALADMRHRSLEWVEHVYGSALPVIAGCLRALYCAAPACDLISTDYNSIEAVGLAMLAGEVWRKKVFATHGKIYEASAATAFRLPLDEILGHKAKTGQHHPLRQKGKGLELACGYQGWVGAAQAFDIPGTEDEIARDILAWRAASPAIEWLWGGQQVRKAASIVRNALQPGYEGTVADWARPLADAPRSDAYLPYYFGVEGMAMLAVLQPGQWNHVFRLDGTDSGIAFFAIGQTLFCRIPSGRLLTYHNVVLEASDRGGFAMSYEGWNTNPKNGPVSRWIRMRTWGGRLVENINQAVCRDILAPACIALEERGYPVVLHVYDEIVAEVPEGVGSVEEFEAIVTVPPAWAADWPIRAPGGYRAKRYRKG